MKDLGIIGIFFFVLLLIAAYLVFKPSNFSNIFESSNLWLNPGNYNLSKLTAYQLITEKIELVEFLRDDVNFANIGYEYTKEGFLDFRYIKISKDIVGKSVYAVKYVDGKKELRLLSYQEAITAFNEWLTTASFEIVKPDPFSEDYKVMNVFINEPIL